MGGSISSRASRRGVHLPSPCLSLNPPPVLIMDQPIVRSPRCLQLQNKEKSNDKMKLKNRRKVLKLATPPPSNTETVGSDGDDSDYAPASDHDVGDAAGRTNRKRRCNQERSHASSCAAAPPPTSAAGAIDEEKKRVAALHCSPSKFKEIVEALDNLKCQVCAKNFGGQLSFKPQYLDRQLLSWLMRKLNPETMRLEIGGGQEIAITENTVWCVFQISNSSSDPPFITDDEARLKRRELEAQLCGHAYNPKVGIRISDLLDGFKKRTLTRALGLRAFFMCAFKSLLFSNTDSYIRIEDVKNTKDLENIGRRNWCKAVVDNLSKAAHLYKKDFAEKGIFAPITGCGIFLTMLYVDNLCSMG